MSGAKHTPGPWFQINGGKCVGGPESTPGLGHGIAACSMRARSEDDAQANATLIAAAPDLLEALKDAERIMASNIYPKPDVGPEHPWSVLQRVRYAIAKAEGRS